MGVARALPAVAAVWVVALGAAVWALWRLETPADRPLVRLDVDLGADAAFPPVGNGSSIAGANGTQALAGAVTPNMDVAVDAVGNVYFASLSTNVIRKISIGPPLPPNTVTVARNTNNIVQVSFFESANHGGIPITGFTASCEGAVASASGTASPINVTYSTPYDGARCRVTATNDQGTHGTLRCALCTQSSAPVLQVSSGTALPAQR